MSQILMKLGSYVPINEKTKCAKSINGAKRPEKENLLFEINFIRKPVIVPHDN